jgi:2-polyprenyl-6-methoxyphenol hydroxylase-like FAD-dependent oxidoreductase
MKALTIAGGGLAGLGLAHGLRLHGVPVTLHEAGRYPRHRVCGEFISGITPETLAALDIAGVLHDARRHLDGAWYADGEKILTFTLPAAALALSRHRLDDRLRQSLAGKGGTIVESSRLERQPREGLVWTAGRLPRRGPWIGLKAHYRGLDLVDGLEMHLGGNGYVGLTPVEEDRVNVCGLFRLDPRREGRGPGLLLDYLRAGGNAALAGRLASATIDATSFLGVSAFELGWQECDPSLCALGDAAGMIPPFTGNGMTMALQSAELALGPLLRWCRDETAWNETVARIRIDLNRKFSRRLIAGAAIHRLLLDKRGLSLARSLAGLGLLPFRPLLALVR